MAVINKQFDAKYGVSIANTIIVDANRNLSNINSLNVATENVTTSNIVSANIATANIASLQGLTINTVNALIVVANTQANYAAATANSAVANAAIANTNALAAYGQANAAYTQANVAYAAANVAYGQANAAYTQANLAYAAANVAYGQANAAIGVANAAANTVATFANGSLILAAANLNFNNTATVNVAVTPNGTGQVNVAFNANTSAGSAAYAQANAAYSQANLAYGQANSAYTQANLAYTQANVANALAQNALPITGGTLTGSLAINGNLYVTGTTVSLNVGSLSTNDAIIYIASNNSADVIDMGIIGYETNATSVNVGTGLIRHATDNKWYLFDGYTDQGRNPTVNVANTFSATLVANVQALSITVGGNAVATAVNTAAAYAAANAAYGQANLAYGQANAAYTQANLAYTAANNANVTGQTAYALANTANNTANAAYAAANAAYGQANLAYAQANSGVFTQVNGIKINGPNGGSQNVYTYGASIGSTGQQPIDTLNTNAFIAADYLITIANNAPGSGGIVVHSTKISIVQDGTNVLIDEYGTIATKLLASFTAAITGSTYNLLVTPLDQPNNGAINIYYTRFTT